MKLVTKYTLVFTVALVVIVVAVGWLRGAHTRRELLADMRRDHHVVGGVLLAGLEELWATSPATAADEARELIAAASSVDPSITFTLSDATDAVATQTSDERWFVSRFPVVVRGVPVRTLVLREALDHLDAMARANLRLGALQIGLIVVCGAIASFVLGRWLVGRPVGQLVAHMRRIGRRDLASRISLRSKDELADLAGEMNAASEALDAAITTAAAETEARIAAVEQVRHADRLATVGKLAAGVAHELGTPLSVVAGHAQMIADGEVTGDAVATSARAIDREAARMSRIVRQLLDFARRKGPEGGTCDPLDVARRATALLAPMADKAKVAITVAGTACQATIDEDSLQQVMTNLLVNAIQAMPAGGALNVAVAASAPSVLVTVTDTGSGMTDEVIARAFEPFFTTKPTGEGTGLGLAVVYGIVVDHGGTIRVASSPAGTTVSVTLKEAA